MQRPFRAMVLVPGPSAQRCSSIRRWTRRTAAAPLRLRDEEGRPPGLRGRSRGDRGNGRKVRRSFQSPFGRHTDPDLRIEGDTGV